MGMHALCRTKMKQTQTNRIKSQQLHGLLGPFLMEAKGEDHLDSFQEGKVTKDNKSVSNVTFEGCYRFAFSFCSGYCKAALGLRKGCARFVTTNSRYI